MQFLVEVEYGFNDSSDLYCGPISEKVEVDAADSNEAETLAWEQIQADNGTDQLTGQEVLTVIEM